MEGRWQARQWLVAILLAGAALRFVPIWFGLPYLHARPDEEVAVFHSLRMLDGDLNPHFFHWPSLTFYLFAALFKIASWIRQLTNAESTIGTAGYFLLARGTVAAAGTLTIYVLFRIGRRVSNTTTGLVAGLFLAVALLHVRDSHFAMTDVLMTLLVTVALAILLRASDPTATSEANILWMFFLAGAVGGLAASTKYSAAAIIGAMAAAQIVLLIRARAGRMSFSRATPSVAFLISFAVGFLVGTPYAILDFPAFERDVRFTMLHLSMGHGVDLGRGWFYHLRRSLPYGLGIPIFAAAVAGIVPLIRHYRWNAIIIGAFAAAFYVSIGSGQTVFFRYVLPLVPVACLSAAIAVTHAAGWLASRSRYSNGALTALLTLVLAAPALINSVWFDALLARTDTRVLAAGWLKARLSPNASLHDAMGPYSRLDLARVPYHPWDFDPATRSFGHPDGSTPDWLVIDQSPLQTYVGTSDVRYLARQPQKYELVQTFAATRGRARSAVYDAQDAFFLPFSRFDTIERPGPTVLIYRRIAP